MLLSGCGLYTEIFKGAFSINSVGGHSIMLYICIMFQANISKCFRVIERMRFVY